MTAAGFVRDSEVRSPGFSRSAASQTEKVTEDQRRSERASVAPAEAGTPNPAAALKSATPVKKFAIRIATHSAVTDSVASWEKQLAAIAASSGDAAAAEKATAAWWNAFWNRSWIFVEGDNAAVSALPANQHPLRIGADSGGGNKFRGTMSRATVFGRALSDAEIASLATGKPSDAAAVTNGKMLGWRFTSAPDGAKVVGAVKFEQQDGVPVAAFGGGHIEAPNEACLAFTNSFTLEAWIRPDAKGGSARIFDKLTAGKSDGFLFDTHPDSSLRLITGQSTMVAIHVLRLGAWNHVAAVYDAATDGRRIYLDGKLLKSEGGGGMEQPTPSLVTRAYVLQRWMGACAGRGNFPVKFNGSIFTVDPEFTDPKQQFNPDWRRWGDCFWWQNTRFPAWSAVANGDYDLCGPVFRMYRDVLPICKARAKFYYGADGAYFPETMTSFGTYANRDYGWNRKGKQPGDVDSKWWRWSWQQGLELVALMLDCYERTLDAKFLADEIVPMAREVLRYFDTRFQRDANGKLVISPTQAVETYWTDVVNDTPTVAGLQDVLDRLLALPKDAAPAAEREFWAKMKAAAPPVPVRTEDGKNFVLPAEKFDPKRSNVENPEIYAIWPFRLFAVGRPGLETGIETFNRRIVKIMTGWCYDGQCAALLGMTDEAKKQILHK
ncbi:MAG: LamG domain-containing protein, partial [Verrucomicrobia bacterium]|nr:LamG domain-containing protein [Verrucomicrobiota bacterium]